MTIFDYIVIAIFAISVIVGLMRGLVKEVLSIAGWFVAMFVAKTYASQVVPFIPDSIPGDGLKVLAAFVILFIASLLITGLISMAISSLFSGVGLGWLNNLLGGFFGFARGIMVASVIVFVLGFTSLPEDARWKNAMFSASIEKVVLTVLDYAPEYIREKVKY
jgi:membrane protein required for colicin V production